MKKLIAFDLDGTLTESRSIMDQEMAGLFTELLRKYKVAVVSGGNFGQFQKQLLDNLPKDAPLENLDLFPINGTLVYTYDKGWKLVRQILFTDTENKEIRNAVDEALRELRADEEFKSQGGFLDDRGGQITVYMIPIDSPLEIKKAYDPDKKKRMPIRDLLEKKLPLFEVKIAGTCSTDITHQGQHKGAVMRYILETRSLQPEEALFVGDAIYPGGNDHEAAKVVPSKAVKGPHDTKELIRALLQQHE